MDRVHALGYHLSLVSNPLKNVRQDSNVLGEYKKAALLSIGLHVALIVLLGSEISFFEKKRLSLRLFPCPHTSCRNHPEAAVIPKPASEPEPELPLKQEEPEPEPFQNQARST